MTQQKKVAGARAIADVTSGTILASVEIAAPAERVFRALTDPQEIVRWWGSQEQYQTTKWDSDFRVTGRWRAEGRSADGGTFAVEGEYLEIDPPHKLVHTWRAPWDGGALTTVTIVIEATQAGSRVTLRHEGFGERHESCRSHGLGWQSVLGWLQGFVTPPQAAGAQPASYFLCRLLGPRPTFAFDMNAEEKALMQEHGKYWRARMVEGHVVVFGPVGDPAGPWGLGIVRAKDLAEVHAFQAADPVVQAERGFRYEIIPMLSAVLPD